MHQKTYYVYILTNHTHSVLYVGITNDIQRRTYEHKNKLVPGFTSKYNLKKLVYYETTTNSIAAIEYEKKLKNLLRSKKELLITAQNPEWIDLSNQINQL